MDPLTEAEKEVGTDEVVRELKRRLDSILSALSSKDIYIGAILSKVGDQKGELTTLRREVTRLRAALKWMRGNVTELFPQELIKELDRKMSKREFNPKDDEVTEET